MYLWRVDVGMAHGLTKEAAIPVADLERALARRLYALRKQAGVSQAELARRVGTTQSVISRLEDADYGGHSLALLQRIAAALERRVEIRFVARRRLEPV